jgi:hypothetical protein
MDAKILAAAARMIARGFADAAAVLEGIPPDAMQKQREADLTREFDKADGVEVALGEDLVLLQASRAQSTRRAGSWRPVFPMSPMSPPL